MWPLELVGLSDLMARTRGRPEVVVGLIDGPVAIGHPDLESAHLREVPGASSRCAVGDSVACAHGTLVAGVLHARRGSAALAICPECTLLIRPVFPETSSAHATMPSATPDELARAILETIRGGARILNLSAALLQATTGGERRLTEALDFAAHRGVIVVAAAGNQGTVGSTLLTRHPWVIPVVGCNPQGRPTPESNMGSSIGRQGLMAPGENIPSLGADGATRTFGGTSAAAPIVTGAAALLWSEFPGAGGTAIKQALIQAHPQRTRSVLPPILNAGQAFRRLMAAA